MICLRCKTFFHYPENPKKKMCYGCDAIAKKEYKERKKESYKKYYECKKMNQNRNPYPNHKLSAIAAMARDRNMSYGQFVARMEMGRPVR